MFDNDRDDQNVFLCSTLWRPALLFTVGIENSRNSHSTLTIVADKFLNLAFSSNIYNVNIFKLHTCIPHFPIPYVSRWMRGDTSIGRHVTTLCARRRDVSVTDTSTRRTRRIEIHVFCNRCNRRFLNDFVYIAIRDVVDLRNQQYSHIVTIVQSSLLLNTYSKNYGIWFWP